MRNSNKHRIAVLVGRPDLRGQGQITQAADQVPYSEVFTSITCVVARHASSMRESIFEGYVGGRVLVWKNKVFPYHICQRCAPLQWGRRVCSFIDQQGDSRGGKGLGRRATIEKGLWGDAGIRIDCNAVTLVFFNRTKTSFEQPLTFANVFSPSMTQIARPGICQCVRVRSTSASNFESRGDSREGVNGCCSRAEVDRQTSTSSSSRRRDKCPGSKLATVMFLASALLTEP